MVFAQSRGLVAAVFAAQMTACTGMFDMNADISRVRADDYTAGVMIALGEKQPGTAESYRLLASAGRDSDRVYICPGTATCGAAVAGAVPARLLRSAGDLNIFVSDAPLTLNAAQTYSAVALQGNAQTATQVFRFSERSAVQNPTGGGGLASITLDLVQNDLKALASDTFQGRGSGDPGNEASAKWVADKFREWGLQPGNSGSYFQEFRISRGNGKTANVIGIIPGTDPVLGSEIVMIGGHVDHLGARSGSVYYGADDNGTGTVAVMAVAKAFAGSQTKPKRTLMFVAWSGEEIGLLGSRHYVSNPVQPLAKHVYYINIDMIGYSKSGEFSALGGGSSSLARSVMQEVAKSHPDLRVNITSSAGGGSDHAPFLSKGIPAVFFHTGLHNNYHTPRDTIEKINYKAFHNITRYAYELMDKLQQHPELGRSSGAPSPDADGLSLVGYERPSLIDDDALFEYDHGGVRFDVDGELESAAN